LAGIHEACNDHLGCIMTTKPTPEQARAYADAVVAWSEGKKVGFRMRSRASHTPEWWSFNGEPYCSDFEYRIVPDPPKAREFWINVYQDGLMGVLRDSRKAADDRATGQRTDCIRIREILDTEIVVDKAEYEELRRNEAALKAAIKDYIGHRKIGGIWIIEHYLDSHGAKL
jgi:hypothetical protein